MKLRKVTELKWAEQFYHHCEELSMKKCSKESEEIARGRQNNDP